MAFWHSLDDDLRILPGHEFVASTERESINRGRRGGIESAFIETNGRTAVHGAEMLNLDGLVVCVQMQRDDSAALILSVYWGRDINIAILAHRQVPHRSQTFRHDTRLKASWKAQPVRLLRQTEPGRQQESISSAELFQILTLPKISLPVRE
jgi:hypothetical protein